MVGTDLTHKPVRFFDLSTSLLALTFLLPGHSWPDSVDCNDYVVEELKSLCTEDNPDQYVYNDVGETGLNDLADSWDTSYLPQLRIIPPGRYVLSKPLAIPSTNRILPHPTLPVPEGSLRTIELVAVDDFRQASDGFYLLQIDGNARAGAIEIHGNNQPPELLSRLRASNISSPKNCLARAVSTTETGFVGAILTGNKALDGLFCDVASNNSSYYQRDNGLFFQRNYLRTRGARGGLVLAAEFDGNLLDIKNNSFFVDPVLDAKEGDTVSGLYLGRLIPHPYDNTNPYLVWHNDFIFPSGTEDSPLVRRGIEIGNASGFQLEMNAFITPGANGLNEHDIAIFDSRAKINGHRIMELSSNSFSPHLVALSANQHGQTMSALVDGSKQYSYSSPYQLEQPKAFMAYQDNLGNIPILTSLIQSGLTPRPLHVISQADLPGSFTGATEYYSYSSQDCDDCSDVVTQAPWFEIFLIIAIPAFTGMVTTGVGWVFYQRGKGKTVSLTRCCR